MFRVIPSVHVALLLLATFAVWSTDANKVRYDNYHVVSAKVENDQHWRLMEQIEGSTDAVRFLKPPAMDRNTELIVAPHKLADVDELLRLHGIKSDVLTSNLQKYGYNWISNIVRKTHNEVFFFSIQGHRRRAAGNSVE